MIVKIQRPLSWSPGSEAIALIYNEDRTVFVQLPFVDFINLFDEEDQKVYHEADVVGTLLHIHERVEDQSW